MPILPFTLPATDPLGESAGEALTAANEFSLYDVALSGVGYMYANTVDNPLVRQTVDYEKNRVDQAVTAGEQTLTNWWLKSQDSFHGGAGQTNLEPPDQNPLAHIRYSLSKNVDPSTPGLLRRLPDTAVISSDDVVGMVGITVSGDDAVVILTSGGDVKLITDLDGAHGSTTFSAVSGVLSVATDGYRIYATDDTSIYALDPASTATSTTVASYPSAVTAAVIGWTKSRLLAGADNAVYEVDVSATSVTLGASELLYTHPTPGWVWRCFGESPTAALAAGDAGSFSEITQFTVQEVAGAPVLQVFGSAGRTPVGERVLSLGDINGSYLGVGTTRGFRVGQYNTYTGYLQLGPLELSPVDPTIPCNAVLSRDRFLYAVGSAYDEGGLICVDTGVQIDQAGRFAWHPHLVAPTTTATAATAGAVLPLSARIVFAIPGTGVLLEGDAPGEGREAYLLTSRIRFGTTEPKLFKLGTVRGDAESSTVIVAGVTESGTVPLSTLSFDGDPPPDFALPSGLNEWLQLRFTLTGADCAMRSYAVKALPGTRRQVRIKLVLMVFDSETTRSGQRIRNRASARDQMNYLEQLAASGDEVLLQEFTPSGTQSTIVQVEQVEFVASGRPTKTSDVGGTANVILRTLNL